MPQKSDLWAAYHRVSTNIHRYYTRSPPGRRRLINIFITLISLYVLFRAAIRFSPRNKYPGPPTYERLRKWETDLPQHNLSLPFPEGRNGRYVKFSTQVRKLGWNNVLNEVLMNAHLAYESERAYVFQDYWWKSGYYYWPREQFLANPPRTPLPALIAGPAAGGPWEPNDPSPRSVSSSYFDLVCPPKTRHIIDVLTIKDGKDIRWSRGDEIFDTWKNILRGSPERCIEIISSTERRVDGYPQIFDLFLWGSERILPLWESFSKSPTSRLLRTSPIVESAVKRNEYIFQPVGPKPTNTIAKPVSMNPYDRMMAIHVRRGDFKKACTELATWNSTFYSWNLLPFLPDSFTPPPGGSWGYNTPENTEFYMKRCLPSFDAIVQKVRDSRRDYINAGKDKGQNGEVYDRTLDVMYLLTNDRSRWMDELIDALRKDGWYTIRTTRDLELDQEQTEVNMAVDMDIARRAAVFIGNGWSSFTSNIVHRRLVDGKEPISIRFY